jgi:tRNA(fMet)-specific endonuclease VapC
LTRYLIDSDWIIDALNGQDLVNQVLNDLASDGLGVSVFSYAEVYQGAYYSRDSSVALQGLQVFLEGKELVEPTLPVFERFAIIRGRLSPEVRRHVGDLDLLIAASALEYDLVLVTRNVKHFRNVPELSIFELDAE